MKNTHDIFLLMFNLSQITDKSKIINLFEESINVLFHPQKFIYSETIPSGIGFYEEISTSNFKYGYISSAKKPGIEIYSMVQNSTQMLSVILERLDFDSQLKQKANNLENVAEERLNEINLYVDELEASRLASLNLIEDMKEEIIEREKAELALMDSEEKFRLSFQTSPDSININRLDDGMYIEINEGFSTITGYKKEEVIGKTSLEINIWENPADRFKLGSILRSNGRIQNYETKFRMKSGHIIYGLMSASLITLNNEPHIISITRDISDIKATQEELKKNERLFRTAFENSATGMCITSLNGKFLQVNNKLCEILGYIESELLKLTFADITHPEDLALSNNMIGKAINKLSDEIYFEKRYLKKNGKVIWAGVSSSLLKDDNSNPLYFITHIIDITERKLIEQEVIKLNKQLELRVAQRTSQLESVNKELESFVYSVSHDLRAPLRSINGFAEIISKRHKDNLNTEGLEYFGFILEASNNMAQLIEDLLRFSRLTKNPVANEPISLKHIFDNVLRNLHQDIIERKAKIIIPKNLPVIESDRALLIQIFTNLIHNGLIYQKNGNIPEVKINVLDTDNKYIIEVIDNGIGIPTEYHEKIFNIFQRLHSNDDYPGTGIGLSIVSKAVKALGGSIEIYSELDKGSTFKISFLKN